MVSDHGLLAAKKGKPSRLCRVGERLFASRPVLHIFNFIFGVGRESGRLGLIRGQAEPASDKGCSEIQSYLRPRCELNIPKPLFCFWITHHHPTIGAVSHFSGHSGALREEASDGMSRAQARFGGRSHSKEKPPTANVSA
jgi:hypothetical protein